jgi:biopolymer transport protein ExbD
MASAGHSFGEDADEEITGINVTPLVDVMLVLLVIFMVTAKMIVSRGVEVARPKAATGGQVTSTILITVDKDGALYVNGDVQPDPATATARVKEILRDAPDSKAIIDGDQAAAYAGIMKAIDVVTAAGIEKVALANAPLAPGGGK